MVNNTSYLKAALSDIVNELLKTGKNESAAFFQKKLDSLNSNFINDMEVIRQLSTCRAMSQYANFSYKEEALLDKITEYASQYISNFP